MASSQLPFEEPISTTANELLLFANSCSLCDADIQNKCVLCKRSNSVHQKRKQSTDCLKKQAKRIKLQSDRNFPDREAGDSVRVSIPQVDRGKTDALIF